METIKRLFSIMFKLIAAGVVVFLLFALAGYFFVEQKNDTAGTIVLLSAVGIIPLWFMRGLILRFIKLSIITILGLVGFALAVSGVLKTFPNIVDSVSDDNVTMGIGALTMLLVAIVAVKALTKVGSLFSGFGGGGGGSYYVPTETADEEHKWIVSVSPSRDRNDSIGAQEYGVIAATSGEAEEVAYNSKSWIGPGGDLRKGYRSISSVRRAALGEYFSASKLS